MGSGELAMYVYYFMMGVCVGFVLCAALFIWRGMRKIRRAYGKNKPPFMPPEM